MATLLFLGASVSQLPAIRYARAAGHRVVAVDGDRDAVGFEIADACVNVDFTDVARVIEAGGEHAVDGVLAVSSDRAVLPAAEIAQALGLPGIGVDVARGMTDKTVMRDRLEEAGVPQPRYAVLARGSDVLAAARVVPLPAVLKPADSGGQRGLFRVEDAEGVERHLEQTLAFSPHGRAMLEEYVDGVELNGILVVRGGEPTLLTLSDRLRPPGAGFGVGWIHRFPSSLAPEVLERVRDVAFDAVRALGLRDGIAFPQLIASDEDVRIVEIAARIAAGQMADLVRLGTGIELFEIAIRQALGQPVPDELVTPGSTRPIAIRFLTASPGVLPLGTVTAVAGLEDVRASEGVLAAGLYFGPGVTITPVQVDADRRGYVVATGETADIALVRADAAARKLVVETRRPRRRRAVVPAAACALAVSGAAVAVVAFGGGIRPRLVGDTIRARGGMLEIGYAFNEPVRAMLLVDGRRATAASALRKTGALLWRRPAGQHRVSIQATDGAGRRSVVSLAAAAAYARRRAAASGRPRRSVRGEAAPFGGRLRARPGSAQA